MVEKIALNEEELAAKLKEMAPDWKAGTNEKGVPYIERVKHAAKYMEGVDFVGIALIGQADEESGCAPHAKLRTRGHISANLF